jgi:hypothetical protein
MSEERPVQRRTLLGASLGFALLEFPRGREPAEIGALRRWLGTWSGIGAITAGMARQGYDVSLACYGELGWRATFYVTGREHAPTGATGSAFEPTPFRAVQVAAWKTLTTEAEACASR